MTARPRNAAERLYALVLRLMPGDFAACSEDALETFRDLAESAARRGPIARLALVRVYLAALGAAVRSRAERDAPRPRDGGWPSRLLRMLRDDARLAGRSLVRRQGFSLTVVAVLALGIGASSSVFSVVDCIVLRPMPYPDAGRLVLFDEGAHPGPLFERWQQQTRSFAMLAAARDRSVDLTGDGPPLALAAAKVSRDFFELFGARAETGRLLGGDDFRPGARPAVLGAALWQRRWGGDPSVVGRTIVLGGEAWTVVGVVDPAFVPPEILVGNRVDVYLPLDLRAGSLANWDTWALSVAARLAPTATLASAQTEIDTIAEQVAAEQPGQRRQRDGTALPTPLVPLRDATVGRVENALLMLLGAVSLMLLVGCVNVGGLFLARGTERQREMALRRALGARPARVGMQLLIESMTLALIAGAVGLALAYGLTGALATLVPVDLPRIGEVAVDARVLAAAVAAAALTGLLFGLAPAWQAMRVRLGGGLTASRAVEAGSRVRRSRSALVVAEVALSLVLLSGAGLLGHSLVRLMSVDLGFQPAGLTRVAVRLGAGYSEERRRHFARELLARVESLPGVRSAALGWSLPFDYVGDHRCCWRSRFAAAGEQEPIASLVHPISPGYFHTLGARLASGREIGWQDAEASPVPVVVNRTAAERLFGEMPALGQPVGMGHHSLTVVGVVEDVKRWGGAEAPDPAVYVPYFRYGGGEEDLRLAVRAEAAASPALADALRDIVWDLDASLPVGEVVTLEQRVDRSLAEPRFYALLLGGFAGLALVLAAVGLCGALLYGVNQRRRELGIRLAVGARSGDLLRLVLGQGLVLAVAGLVLGLAGSVSLSRVLAGLVYDISATDPITYLAVSLLLLAVALLAAYLPARAAARTDPIATLRAE